MFKKALFFLITASLSQFSYAQENTNDEYIKLNGAVNSINEELNTQRASLGVLKAALEDEKVANKHILNELKALRRQNQSLVDALFNQNNQITNANGEVMKIKPIADYDKQTPDGKMYWGEEEYFFIKELNATVDARIDTGATVSSIDATNITEFERKGKKWLRFDFRSNDRTLQVEAPFVRYSDIRQSTKEITTRRYVVSLNIKIGSYSTASEFTLADRSKLNYPLLIGRTLMQDIAVVDVSRSYVQDRADKDGLIFINRDDYLKNKKKGIDLNKEHDEKEASKEGMIATPVTDNVTNLGNDPTKALPKVVKKETDKE